MIEKIQKRNGQMVAFDSVKILNAISRANMAVEDEVMEPADLSYLTQKVCSQLNPDEVVTVEHVQDVVEETLIRFDYAKTAKAYILYRAEHTKIRQTESDLMDIYSKLTYSSAMDEDIKRENANIDALLSLDTLSTMISAQNFSMPAGYIEDKSDHQWLVEVGDNFTNEKQLNNLVLTKIDGVGKIRVKDVADVTVVDNQGEAYSKVNGENAILLSVFKGSTSNTSTVSKGIQNAFKKLEQKYKGLSFAIIMNQGEYINIIIKSVSARQSLLHSVFRLVYYLRLLSCTLLESILMLCLWLDFVLESVCL